MWTLGVPPLELVARTVIVYLIFLAALRLFGKREIGQFTLFDLALVLLAANALQPALTGPDQSVTGGLIIVVTIFVLNRFVLGPPTTGADGPPPARIRADGRRHATAPG